MVETIIDSSELSLDSGLLNLVIPSAKVIIDDKEEEFNLEFEGINTTIPLLIAKQKIQNNNIISYPNKFKFLINDEIKEVEQLIIKLVDNLLYEKKQRFSRL